MRAKASWINRVLALAAVGVFFAAQPASAQVYDSITLSTPQGSYYYVYPVSPIFLNYPYYNYYYPYYYQAGSYGLPYGAAGAYPYAGTYRATSFAAGGAFAADSEAGGMSPLAALTPLSLTAAAAPSPSASIEVLVPANAEVTVQGKKMTQGGTNRKFVSPPLNPGEAYTYTVSATWKQDGKQVTQKRNLTVQAGDRQSVLFLGGPSRPPANQRTSLQP
jgi:uncharacterized protein (TIGR03000 family)